jgi:hypothetical protein
MISAVVGAGRGVGLRDRDPVQRLRGSVRGRLAAAWQQCRTGSTVPRRDLNRAEL